MRTILVQRPTTVRRVFIQGYQDGWEAMAELLEGPDQTARERHYAKLVAALTHAVGLEQGRAEDRGWATLWTRNEEVGTDLGEQSWRTWISVDDDHGGERTFAALLQALDAKGVVHTSEAGPAPLLADSHPVHARWGRWCFGPQRGSIEAVLCLEDGVVGVEVVRETPLPALTCPACEETSIPLPRILGYPSPEGELGILLGECTYGSCVLGDPMATAECGVCGVGLVPGTADEEEAMTGAVGPLVRPERVERFRRLFEAGSGGTMVWTPYASQRGNGWTFSLSAAVVQRLSEAPGAVVALRPRGLPALFVPWSHIEPMIEDRERERTALRVSRREPTTVKIGQRASVAVTHPRHLTPPPPAPRAPRRGAAGRSTAPETGAGDRGSG